MMNGMMKKMRRGGLSLLLMGFLVFPGMVTAEEGPDFGAILGRIEGSRSFADTDFSCVYTMVNQKPGEDISVTRFRLFRRDGEDKLVLLILEPEVQKGQGYLRVRENVWFYDPESRKFAHSSLKVNIQDSEAKSSDFSELSLVKDYGVAEWEETTLGQYPVYKVTLDAKNNEVPYPRIILWIRQDRDMILKEEDYSLSGRLMRTAYFPNYGRVGGRLLPTRMLFVDELREGEKTQITMKETSLEDLPDSLFTKAYLERVNN